MSNSFNKNGVVSSSDIYESSSMNLVVDPFVKHSFVPTANLQNSTMRGYTVDYSSCNPGDVIYVRIKVEWSGFETDIPDNFMIKFQGPLMKKGTTDQNNQDNLSWSNYTANYITKEQDLAKLIEANPSGGTAIIETTVPVRSDVPEVYDREFIGARADYSNGIGKITLSNLEVIPEKYYSGPLKSSLKIGSDYMSVKEIYEY